MRGTASRFFCLLLVFATVAVAGCLSCDRSRSGGEQTGGTAADTGTTAPEEVVVGVDVPMTGNLSYYGEVVSRGLTLAVDRYNKQRSEGEPEVELAIQDNYGQVSEAVKVFNKLVGQDGAAAVVSLFTPHSTALLPFSAKQETVLYATVTSVVEFGVKSPYAFRDFISLPSQGEQMGRYLAEKAEVTKVGSLVVNDDYGLDALRLVKEQFIKRGGQWGQEEVFEQRDINIRDPATKVIASNPDAIYIGGRELSLANAIRQTRELGFEGPIVSNNSFDSPTVYKAVGDAGEGVVYTSSTFDVLDPANAKQARFVKEYRERFDQDPDYNAAHGYTVGLALTSAIAEVGGDSQKLRDELQGYEVVDMLGEGKMTHVRDLTREVALYRFAKGKRVRINLD